MASPSSPARASAAESIDQCINQETKGRALIEDLCEIPFHRAWMGELPTRAADELLDGRWRTASGVVGRGRQPMAQPTGTTGTDVGRRWAKVHWSRRMISRRRKE
jgi:hypothetical protein